MRNLKTASRYLEAEHEVIRTIRCRLCNNRLTDESVVSGGISFSLSWSDDICTAVIESPVSEVLQAEYDADNRTVYDYRCIRNH